MRRALVLVLAAFGLANVARAVLAVLAMTNGLAAFTDIPPIYLIAMSLVWAAAFGMATWGIVRSRRWGPRGTIAVTVLYQANLWLNRLAFTRSEEAVGRTGFAALLSVLSIVLIVSSALFVQSNINRQAQRKTQDS